MRSNDAALKVQHGMAFVFSAHGVWREASERPDTHPRVGKFSLTTEIAVKREYFCPQARDAVAAVEI
jgi:hypothetical protein